MRYEKDTDAGKLVTTVFNDKKLMLKKKGKEWKMTKRQIEMKRANEIAWNLRLKKISL